ncbi:MAG: RHS repeat-associated core domain-containing protein [Simkaniaceae bacterium]
MIRVIMTLICCLFMTPAFAYDEEAKEEFFLSTPEQVASLSSEPEFLIGGLISPLSGRPTLRITDLVAKGAQNITLSRIYIAPQMPCHFPKEKHHQEESDKYNLYQHVAHNYKGWQFYPHLKLQFTPSSQKILLTDPSGMTLNFELNGCKAKLSSLAFGLSNASGETPSGKYDPRNTKVSYEADGNKITVHTADGTTRLYYRKGWSTRSDQLYLLEKEILPSGKVLKYHYDESWQLTYVESLDPKERFVYASLQINGSPWASSCRFTSSSGQTTDYKYEKRTIHVKVKEKTKHWYGDKRHKEEYNFLCPPILSSISSPLFRHESLDYCGKFQLGSYSGKDDVFKVVNKGFGEGPQHFRVHKLLLPVGQGDGFEPVYELSYQPPEAGEKSGTTTVKNSDGTSITYHFSKNLLTTAIQYFGEDRILKKEKIFSWDDKNWLKAVEMRDAQKKLLYKKSFEYDKFGNPTTEVFSGDLTGEGGQDTFTTKRRFSEDGKNLLLREETDDGKVVCFTYLPNTNLLTLKLTKNGDKIILREFSCYDDCHNLIQTISDDGVSENKDDLSHVTQRLITSYLLRASAPFLHMPEWVIETYLESGIEKPLKKAHLVYDQHGNVAEEEIFDAEDTLAYTIYKTYNERGDILGETNRLGQQAVYSYDAKGRLKHKENFSGRIHKNFSYDTKGRLRKIVEEGDDGNRHTISSRYDFYDRLVERQDPFGNRTYYKYDPLINEIIQTEFPSIASAIGQATAVTTHSSYDPFGRELTKTDPNGNVTTFQYNAYGSPVEIFYQSGGKEHFRYALNGKLISHTDPDGLTIRMQNDVLGRVLKKTYISKQDEILAEETFTYSGFNLLTETDKEGNLKHYSYDGAGRKIREEFCGRVTEFKYDPLGRLATVYKHNGDDALVTHYERDLEDRVTLEKKTDLAGHLLYKMSYSYDADGNRESIIRIINGEEAIESFAYDPFQRKILKKDALGYETQISYDETHSNILGQKVLQVKTIDPDGVSILETQGALTRNVKVEKLGLSGQVVSCHEMTYDPQGNLIFHRDHVYEDERFQTTQTVKYSYTPDHQVESLTRGYGTQNARETNYAYSPSGKMEKKTHPDGITLYYRYHPLGFLARVDSSDGMIHHAFTHNKLGHLLLAVDEKQNLTIEREVDPFGNVTAEIFPHGARITKTYDDFNRLLSLNVVGYGQVRYVYDPMFLRKIERESARGSILYKHEYDEYDQSGNLIQESLIGNLGTITHATDPRGQKTHIASSYFSEEYKYDAVQNLISKITNKAESHYQYDDTSQMLQEASPSNANNYSSDSLYNRIQKNGNLYEVNDLNELLSDDSAIYEYDLRGNQILKKTGLSQLQMVYDPFNQLIEAKSKKQKVAFIYDPLGRRLAKTVTKKGWYGSEKSAREYYLYDEDEEIGSFNASSAPLSFRVLSTHRLPKTVSIEKEGKTFAPLTDVQGNIRRLVDLRAKTLAASYDFTAFGEKIQTKENLQSPWQFASKRFDSELDLIYFGKRYYDPGVGRWITTDPAGLEDSFNPYQYVLNNPFRYYDPNGENLGGYLLGLGEIALGSAILVGGLALEVTTVGGFTIGVGVTTKTGAALILGGLATTTYHAQDIKFPNISWKNTHVYVPDRPLPRDPRTKEPVPEADVSHTELGTKDGTKGKYPQAREFDAQGKPVKDIDFTDHGRPKKHPNPHEHKWKPNPTGGTPQRSPEAESLS